MSTSKELESVSRVTLVNTQILLVSLFAIHVRLVFIVFMGQAFVPVVCQEIYLVAMLLIHVFHVMLGDTLIEVLPLNAKIVLQESSLI